MNAEAPSLQRRLGVGDAIVIGLGAMLGAGVFAAFGPAAAAAGSGLLLGLGLAAIIAYCNATSSAQLAAVYPQAGGTYVYGRERLGDFWGYLAGWAFVVGKLASCSAMALTFGAYAWPQQPRVAGLAAIAAVTAINLMGVRKTALATRVILGLVVLALTLVVIAGFTGGAPGSGASGLTALGDATPTGILQAAGLLFFAFAGYARIATLGEEVVDPATTIPRAIPLALGIAVAVYAVVAVAALMSLGPDGLAGADAPLLAVVQASPLQGLAPLISIGAAIASFGVLLSLTVGVSRTALAMARNGELPRPLARVHERRRVPHVAEASVAVIVVAVVALADLRGAIGFNSFAVLTYYAIANASAWTQPPGQRRWPRALQALGLAGCVLLAVSLPSASVLTGAAVLALGAGIWGVRRGVSPS